MKKKAQDAKREGEVLKGRRDNGEGSVYRRKNGRVVGEYTDPLGRRRYVSGKDKNVVKARLRRKISEIESGMFFDDGGLTLGDYLDKWLDTVRDTVKSRTWTRHEEVVRLHLKPTLGRVKLQRLDALKVQTLYRHKLDEGLSARTVQIIHATLYKALKRAVRWRLVPRNVADDVGRRSETTAARDTASHGGRGPAAPRRGARRLVGGSVRSRSHHRHETRRDIRAQMGGCGPRRARPTGSENGVGGTGERSENSRVPTSDRALA